MSEELKEPSQSNESSWTRSAFRGALGLGLFAILTAGLIAVTKVGTKERIENEIAQARAAALYQIVPAELRDNDLLADSFTITANEFDGVKTVSLAKLNGQTQALVLPWTAPNGYTGAIDLLVAITSAGEILGVRVVSHQETPGLGDKIERKKSDWILGFSGKSLTEPSAELWAVRKDGGEFDQLTGATITPRAVVAAVYDSLHFFEKHQVALLNQSANTPLNLENSNYE